MFYLAFLRTAWPYIAAVALAAGCAWWVWDSGADHERAKADAEISALTLIHSEALAEIDRAHRAALQAATERVRIAEQSALTRINEIDQRYTQEVQSAQALADDALRALRAGELRLRERFTCPAGSAAGAGTGLPGAAGASGSGDDSAAGGLRAADQEFFIRIAEEADTVARQLAACQAVITADRQGVPK